MKHLRYPNARKLWVSLFSFLLLIFTTTCQYYKIREVKMEDYPAFLSKKESNSEFYLHKGAVVYHFRVERIQGKVMEGKLSLSPKPIYPGHVEDNQRVEKHEQAIYDEVHLFADADLNISTLPNDFRGISLNDINRIEVVKPDPGRRVLIVVPVIIGTLVTLIILMGDYGGMNTDIL